MPRVRPHFAAAAMAGLLTVFLTAPAYPGQAEVDLLSSYVGKWSGEGDFIGGKAPEPFKCRLTIAKGNQAKINYSGRCTLVNFNLSVGGTIAYDDSARRYLAVMSSNAGFTGYATGVQTGDRISFDLAERETDSGGNDVRIGARIELKGSSITVDFEVEFNNSGQVSTASVPFSR